MVVPQARRPVSAYDEYMNLSIELEREDDGRWIAEALELPGVMTYGATREEAISNTEKLAIEVIAHRIKHGELPSSALNVSFSLDESQTFLPLFPATYTFRTPFLPPPRVIM